MEAEKSSRGYSDNSAPNYQRAAKRVKLIHQITADYSASGMAEWEIRAVR